MSTLVVGGARIAFGPLSAGLVPAFAFAQNGSFDFLPGDTLRDRSRYANRFHRGIDLPQRFGQDALVQVDPGQSFVRLDLLGLTVGASTENLWAGPAARYPILMSNTAPGFPHVFAGSSRPIDAWVGDLDIKVIVGNLVESDYFDTDPANNHSRLTLWLVGFRPRWVEGLEFGIGRSYVLHRDEASALDQLGSTLGLVSERNLPGNELAAVYGRLIFPESGAEIYAEWGRDDRWLDITHDLLPEPDHAQGYVLGFQRLSAVGTDRHVRVAGELAHLQESPLVGRNAAIFYTHHQAVQGYTHRGQLLGAFIGPGADAQFIAVDLLGSTTSAGLFIERIRRNDNTPAARAAQRGSPYISDTELSVGTSITIVRAPYLLSGALVWARRPDRDFAFDESALRLTLQGSWIP